MASSKTITNPFTKNDSRMKRNTYNTKWVADRGRATKKQTGSKARFEQFSKSPSNRGNQESFHSGGDVETFPLFLKKLQVVSEQTKVSDSSILWYCSGKNMYNSRLKSENQAVWTTWKMYQQAHSEHTLNLLADQDVSSLYQIPPESDRSLCSHRHAVVFPVFLPETAHTQHEKNEKEITNMHARKNSGILHSYTELSISIQKCTNQAVNVDKPLPPVPRIKSVPKPVRMGGLSSSPRPVALPKDTKTPSKKLQTETEPNPPWWTRPHLATPQATLKSKISFPGPLAASKNSSFANIATEFERVDGSAAAISLPIKYTDALLPPSPPKTISSAKHEGNIIQSLPLHTPVLGTPRCKSAADMKTRRKAVEIRDHAPSTNWRDAFVKSAFEASKFIKQSVSEKLDGVVHVSRRRKSSDVSFMCQGVGKGGLDAWD